MNKHKVKKIMAYILGTICFLPAFLGMWLVGLISPIRAVILLAITQAMWLQSIHMLTTETDLENMELKKRIKELEETI